jgi:hypothetical protein
MNERRRAEAAEEKLLELAELIRESKNARQWCESIVAAADRLSPRKLTLHEAASDILGILERRQDWTGDALHNAIDNLSNALKRGKP